MVLVEALLAARGMLFEQWQKLEKRLRSLAREDGRVRRLMTAPGVGTIVALTYAAAIDDPGRFRSSKASYGRLKLRSARRVGQGRWWSTGRCVAGARGGAGRRYSS